MLLVAIGTSLAGCAGTKFATVDAVAKALPVAEYEIKGRTRYDQLYIDKTIEVEVVGLGHPRPKKRPASLDANPNAVRAVVVEAPEPSTPFAPKAAPVVTVKKPTVWQRIRHPIKTYKQRKELQGG